MNNELADAGWLASVEVRINGERLPAERLLSEYRTLCAGYAVQMSAEELAAQRERIRRDAVENAIERTLLLEEARRRLGPVPTAQIESALTRWRRERPPGSPEPTAAETAQMREAIAEQLLLDRFFEQLCEAVPRPTTDELRAWYAEHSQELQRDEQVRLLLITLPARPGGPGPHERVRALLNARERWLAGEPLEAITREAGGWLSADDLGWQEMQRLASALRTAVGGLAPGAISEVFASPAGHHLVRVVDRRPAGPAPFAEVWREIEQRLWNGRKEECIGREADRLRAAAVIEVIGLPSDPAISGGG
ncbi:MAG: peptidylprolyl isomerase [Kiritimatiellae bacterium]|nr:peptidylprolyl isomerase [Kiritimatiellia bacterium]